MTSLLPSITISGQPPQLLWLAGPDGGRGTPGQAAVSSDRGVFDHALREAVDQSDQFMSVNHSEQMHGIVAQHAAAQQPLPLPDRHQMMLLEAADQPMALNARRMVDFDEVRKSAEQLVASALLTPLMEAMNTSPMRPTEGPFAPTLGEKRFSPLLHQHMADRMMQSRSFGLVDAVVERMIGNRIEVKA